MRVDVFFHALSCSLESLACGWLAGWLALGARSLLT